MDEVVRTHTQLQEAYGQLANKCTEQQAQLGDLDGMKSQWLQVYNIVIKHDQLAINQHR